MIKRVSAILVLVLVVSLIGFVSASTKVEVKMDMGKKIFIRVKDVNTGEIIIRAPRMTNYPTGAAITEFETGRSEVNILVLIADEYGNVIENIVEGPFETGGVIEIDVRTNKPDPIEVPEVVPEPEEPEELAEEIDGVLEETPSGFEGEEESEEELTEETTSEGSDDGVEITGKSVFYRKTHDEDGSLKFGYPIGAFLVFVFLVTGLILMTSRKKGKKPLDELGKLQKQVDKKAKEIQAIKQARAYKSRVNQAKMELEREEEVLKSLNNRDQGQDQDKIDQAKIELARKERILDSLKAEEDN
jgi:hypothetical protein